MDRRKAEARSQLQKLKAECAITLNLLHRVISESSRHVSELEQLDIKDPNSRPLCSKHFLAVSQFQHLSHQKLLELNVDLEEHLLEGNPQYLNNCATGDSSSVLNGIKSELDVASLSSLIENELLVVNESCNNSARAISDLDDDNNSLRLNHTEIRDCQERSEDANRDNETVISPTLNKKSPSVSTLFEEANVGVDSKSELNDSNSSEYLPCESSKGPVKTDEFCDSSSDSLYQEPDLIDFAKEVQNEPTASTNITEKLKQLPLMTLEDKFFQNLPRAPMPDLSLKATSQKTKTCSKSSDGDVAKRATPPKKDGKSEKVSDGDRVADVDSATATKKDGKSPKMSDRIPDVLISDGKFAMEKCEIKDRAPPKVGDLCMIGYIKSPSEFYIQVADTNSPLLDLWSDQLADMYGSSHSPFASKADAMETLGNFCCVQYDYFWYRAEIVYWNLNSMGDEEDFVLAQLADYGNIDVVSYKQLRPLPKGFCHVPKMAQRCHLAYLNPPGSTLHHKQKEWPKESRQGFFEICGDLDNTSFQVMYIMPCNERKSFEVDLLKQNEDGDVTEDSVGQMLIDQGFAVVAMDDAADVVKNPIMIDQIRTAHGVQHIEPDMSKEEILDRYFQQSIDEEAANINEAVMHYNPRDEAETCRNLRPDGTCYKGSRCKLRHTPLRDGYTRDREVIYQEAFVDAPLPRIDDEIVVTISHIESIQCFYAQIQPEGNQHSFTPTINNLIKTMNSLDTTKMYQKLQHPPCPNQLVIAKHWNTYWYRAQVRDVQIPESNDEVTAEVYFVDFGDKLTVPISQLRTIVVDFLDMPFQAIECSLFNVKHKEGLEAAEEKRYFESLYLGKTLTAKIIATPGHLEVLLKNSRNEDIGLQLIEDGFGELNTMHNFPAKNELILID